MSERYAESKELTDFPPSTTTISTVAVQAGRSKVVLAVLRVSNLQLAILIGASNQSTQKPSHYHSSPTSEKYHTVQLSANTI